MESLHRLFISPRIDALGSPRGQGMARRWAERGAAPFVCKREPVHTLLTGSLAAWYVAGAAPAAAGGVSGLLPAWSAAVVRHRCAFLRYEEMGWK